MYCNQIYQTLNLLAVHKFENDQIVLPSNNNDAIFFTSKEFCKIVIPQSRMHYYQGVTNGLCLEKNNLNSIGNDVSKDFIERHRKTTIVYLNLISINWKYSYKANFRHMGLEGPHVYERINKDPKLLDAHNVLADIKKTHNFSYKDISIYVKQEVRLSGWNKEIIDQFLACLKKEAIQSYLPIHTLMCAKNDPKWSWIVEGLTIPMDIIIAITKLFIDNFMSVIETK